MTSTFEEYVFTLANSKCPEDVFGKLKTEEELKSLYREISANVHPDLWMTD